MTNIPAGQMELPDHWGHWIDRYGCHWWIFGKPGKFMAQCLDPETGMPDDEIPSHQLQELKGPRGGWQRASASGGEGVGSGFDFAPSWRATAKHLREMLNGERHTQAVSDCRHCTMKYAAITLEEFADGKHAAPAPSLEAALRAKIGEWLKEASGSGGERSYNADMLYKCVRELEQLLSAPAVSEARMVKGKPCYIDQIYQDRWKIFSEPNRKGLQFSRSGEWVEFTTCYWPDRASALAFIEQHADRPSDGGEGLVWMGSSGLSVGRLIAEGIMLKLGMNALDFRQRDPLVVIACKVIEKFIPSPESVAQLRSDLSVAEARIAKLLNMLYPKCDYQPDCRLEQGHAGPCAIRLAEHGTTQSEEGAINCLPSSSKPPNLKGPSR